MDLIHLASQSSVDVRVYHSWQLPCRLLGDNHCYQVVMTHPTSAQPLILTLHTGMHGDLKEQILAGPAATVGGTSSTYSLRWGCSGSSTAPLVCRL